MAEEAAKRPPILTVVGRAEWENKLLRRPRGKLLPVQANVMLILQHDGKLQDVWGREAGTGLVVVCKPVPSPRDLFRDRPGRYPDLMHDVDLTNLLIYLQVVWCEKFGERTTWRALKAHVAALPEEVTLEYPA